MANTTLKTYQEKATNLIIQALEKGVAVWTQPWIIAAGDHGLFNRFCYRGSNILTTAAAKVDADMQSNVWLTFKKFKELREKYPDLKMKAGSKGVPIVYWFRTEKTDSNGEVVLNSKGNPYVIMFPKTYTVFNADCFAGVNLEELETKEPLLSVERCTSAKAAVDEILASYVDHPQMFYERQGRAYYIPSLHEVHVPPYEYFKSEAEAFSTIAHELVHSTGPKLKRDQSGGFGSQAYSYEELVAECGCTILCARKGYLEQTVENSAAYLKGWAKALKDHPNWLYEAMRDAEKAVCLILGETDGEHAGEELSNAV